MKVFSDKIGYEQRKFMNFKKVWFPWKPVDVRLGTISENARIGDCYQCAKFYACIKKCPIYLKFQVMPPNYMQMNYSYASNLPYKNFCKLAKQAETTRNYPKHVLVMIKHSLANSQINLIPEYTVFLHAEPFSTKQTRTIVYAYN